MARTGRPSTINQRIGERPDGTPITVADQIVDHVRAVGAEVAVAAAVVGVHRDTVYDWLKIGARARARINRPGSERLTVHETRCLDFSDRYIAAEAEWHMRQLVTLERSQQPQTRTITTEKLDPAGNVIERTVRTEIVPGDTDAAKWRLQRKHRDLYADRVEVTGADGSPLIPQAERARDLARNLEAWKAGTEDQRALDEERQANGNGHG